MLPFEKPILTSGFGNREINGRIEFHAGIDVIPSGTGLWIINGQWCGGDTEKVKEQIQRRLNTHILAVESGLVTFAGYLAGGGNTVIIDSVIAGDGELPIKIRIGYSHLQDGLQVQEGENVTEGRIIGYMGYSDVVYEQTHLHLGLSVNPIQDPRFIYHDGQQNPIGFLFGYQWNVPDGCNEIILRS